MDPETEVCFVCSTDLFYKSDPLNLEESGEYSFSNCFKDLEKDIGQVFNQKTNQGIDNGSGVTGVPDNFKVNLCPDCKSSCEKYSSLFKQLQLIKAKITSCLEGIHLKLTNSGEESRGNYAALMFYDIRASLIEKTSRNLDLLKNCQNGDETENSNSFNEDVSSSLPGPSSRKRPRKASSINQPLLDMEGNDVSRSSSENELEAIEQEIEEIKHSESRLMPEPEAIQIIPSSYEDGQEDSNNTLTVANNEDEEDPSPVEPISTKIIFNETTKLWECPECPREGPSRKNMIDHYRRIHIDKNLYRCEVCHYFKGFRSRKELAKHMAICLERKKLALEDKEGKGFFCDICWAQSANKKYFRIHRKNMHFVGV